MGKSALVFGEKGNQGNDTLDFRHLVILEIHREDRVALLVLLLITEVAGSFSD